MITSFQKILGCFGMRRCAAALALATAAVVGSGVAGCSKEDTPAGSRVGETVLVRLPGVSVAAPVEVVPGAWGASAGGAVPRGIVPQDAAPCAAAPDAAPDGGLASADDAGELFSVTLGALPAADAATERGTAGTAGTAGSAGTAAAGTSSAPATRADAELTNVWVFQFDAAGKAVQCRKVDALAAGRPLEVRLNSGDGYTIGVVAGGPASGLSTETVPDLAAFREVLLFTSPVTSFEEVPYAGTLAGVRVLVNGQVQVGDSGANVPVITLRRCMAQVTVALTHNVTDYALDGVELYSVPVGAAFAPDRTAAVFPAAADANFGYRDNAAAGLAPHVQSTTGGTGRSYTWYIGQNRRGSGTGIVKVQDKNASKAPAYATYARVKTHSTTAADAPLYYDIYLGEDMFSDFNVTANHVYSYATRIVGSAAAHYSLIDTDGRVSGKKPPYVTSATVTPAGDIPAEGKAYSLTLTGLLPDEGVQVRAQSGGTALATGKVTASGTAVSLAVPANASYTSRTVAFEYLWNGTWTKIGADRTQAGYSVSNATHNAPSTIPGQGGSYNVTLTGYLPSNVAVRAQSGGTAIVSGTVTKSGTAVLLTVPGNQSYNNRSVTFEYNWNGTWTKIGAACSQQGWNVTKASVSPAGDIPAAGGTYTVTLTGWGGYQVRAMSGSTQLVIKTDFTEVANYSATIEIPANPSTESSRTVTFQYRYNGKWADIDSRTQPARAILMSWEQCKTQCESRGGIPSAGELKTMGWAGWPVSGTGPNRWWAGDTEGWGNGWIKLVYFSTDFSSATEDSIIPGANSKAGCRCLND